jgi:hypothetical protein
MWILPVLATNIVAALLTVAVGSRKLEAKKLLPWDIPRAAATFTTIVGSLSGFAVATSIFVANLRVNQSSSEFESVMGLFLTGFIVLVATAMMFGSIPNHPRLTARQEQIGSAQTTTYALANVNYYLGIASTWLALRPLLVALQLPLMASMFSWVLLLVVIAGALTSVHVHIPVNAIRQAYSSIIAPGEFWVQFYLPISLSSCFSSYVAFEQPAIGLYDDLVCFRRHGIRF